MHPAFAFFLLKSCSDLLGCKSGHVIPSRFLQRRAAFFSAPFSSIFCGVATIIEWRFHCIDGPPSFSGEPYLIRCLPIFLYASSALIVCVSFCSAYSIVRTKKVEGAYGGRSAVSCELTGRSWVLQQQGIWMRLR
ncbi:hypothetical protein BD289DRAFT_55840 [Coniella lustricola]|uniref:Uncharacterized protein n=1 Tax=Coniella lustricola TaxID=2025994 RepID=A0A2T3AI33_9PEZI|nr:hypothetical protein BD289DRAFT_55840 [Coniella lustricola]